MWRRLSRLLQQPRCPSQVLTGSLPRLTVLNCFEQSGIGAGQKANVNGIAGMGQQEWLARRVEPNLGSITHLVHAVLWLDEQNLNTWVTCHVDT